MKFLIIAVKNEILAPPSMPSGRRNMLATECSRPMATKVEMGNQMPPILPVRSLAAPASQTAMQTNQLHIIAFATVGPKVLLHFLTAVATARSLTPYDRMPVYLAAKAKRPHPITLPT